MEQSQNSTSVDNPMETEDLSKKRKSSEADQDREHVEGSGQNTEQLRASKKPKVKDDSPVDQLPSPPSKAENPQEVPLPTHGMGESISENSTEIAPVKDSTAEPASIDLDDQSIYDQAAVTIEPYLGDDMEGASDWDGFGSEIDIEKDVAEDDQISGWERGPEVKECNVMEGVISCGEEEQARKENGDEAQAEGEKGDKEEVGGENGAEESIDLECESEEQADGESGDEEWDDMENDYEESGIAGGQSLSSNIF